MLQQKKEDNYTNRKVEQMISFIKNYLAQQCLMFALLSQNMNELISFSSWKCLKFALINLSVKLINSSFKLINLNVVSS